ncbi:MAG: SDR family oxidoreductase [Bacteroidetes bacterium]|nr:SDR family oxidoreductase [Bacteroidota bacterium]
MKQIFMGGSMQSEVEKLFSLEKKVAMIVGGAQNLGWDMAEILAAAGADIIITSRNKDKAQKAASALAERFDVSTLGLGLDQTSSSAVAEVFIEAFNWKGVLDILINNAGGGGTAGSTRLLYREAQDVDKVLKTNLNGMLYCSKEAAVIMKKQGRGKIINIASMAGLMGRDRRLYDICGMEGQSIDYAASKAGVIGATKDLAAYLGPMGITVNSISPGGFSGNPNRVSEKFNEEYSKRTPLGRMGRDGTDIKGIILFLAAPASDYITGENIVIDGGFSIWN